MLCMVSFVCVFCAAWQEIAAAPRKAWRLRRQLSMESGPQGLHIYFSTPTMVPESPEKVVRHCSSGCYTKRERAMKPARALPPAPQGSTSERERGRVCQADSGTAKTGSSPIHLLEQTTCTRCTGASEPERERERAAGCAHRLVRTWDCPFIFTRVGEDCREMLVIREGRLWEKRRFSCIASRVSAMSGGTRL
jgi:hypothetical protein